MILFDGLLNLSLNPCIDFFGSKETKNNYSLGKCTLLSKQNKKTSNLDTFPAQIMLDYLGWRCFGCSYCGCCSPSLGCVYAFDRYKCKI